MGKDEIFSQLERSIQRLCEDHPEVREAILFGSLARGDHGTRSDADVLIVLEDSPHERFFNRIPELIPYFLEVDVPVDIFPYTSAEIELMESTDNLLLKQVREEGVRLTG